MYVWAYFPLQKDISSTKDFTYWAVRSKYLSWFRKVLTRTVYIIFPPAASKNPRKRQRRFCPSPRQQNIKYLLRKDSVSPVQGHRRDTCCFALFWVGTPILLSGIPHCPMPAVGLPPSPGPPPIPPLLPHSTAFTVCSDQISPPPPCWEGQPTAGSWQLMPPSAGRSRNKSLARAGTEEQAAWWQGRRDSHERTHSPPPSNTHLGGQNANLIKIGMKESFNQNRTNGSAACPFLWVQNSFSKATWTWFWAAWSQQPCLSKAWSRGPPEILPTSTSPLSTSISLMNEYIKI